MALQTFLTTLADSAFGVRMAESAWLFPAIETVHVVAIALVVGSIARVDLRLLGWTQRDRAASAVIAEWLPWTWTAFALAVPSGLALFMAKPLVYAASLPLQLKLVSIGAAGLNMLWFHHVTQRRAPQADVGPPTPAMRLAGGLSLALWVGVVLLGRWIGFVR